MTSRVKPAQYFITRCCQTDASFGALFAEVI